MRRVLVLAAVGVAGLLTGAGSAGAVQRGPIEVRGPDGPGPAASDRVRLIRSGPARARRVLVLMPGTSAGAGNTALVGEAIAARLPGWQVWSISRRETLLEDHGVMERALRGEVSARAAFDYYLGWIGNPAITDHVRIPADAEVAYARRWGLATAIGDLRAVVRRARRGGRTVVLGGHSLGATIAAAYATWDFAGQPGVRDLAGLVLVDGGTGASRVRTRAQARRALAAHARTSPFLDLGGSGLPWTVGVFGELGATLTLRDPTAPSLFATWPLLPAALRPPVPTTARGHFGYGVDSETSPASLALAHVHAGRLAAAGEPRDWVDGELVPIERAARVFANPRLGGTSWFHPRRLSLDGSAVNGGVRTPAQDALGVRAWHGDDLDVPIYAFETSLGDGRVLRGARALARRSGIPRERTTLVDRSASTSHLDPLAAAPERNDFLRTVVPFLRAIDP